MKGLVDAEVENEPMSGTNFRQFDNHRVIF